MKTNYKMTISYDGTKYSGWQSQHNTSNTIQSKIEGVISKLCGEAVTIIGAGRTDSGVHAEGMVANVHLNMEITCDKLKNYLNKYLPADICIKDIKEASERFHSRYNATAKLYKYSCYIGNEKPVFDRNYVYIIDKAMNIDKMRQAKDLLIGTHDFKAFCGNPKFNKSSVRNIKEIKIYTEKDYLYFTYYGDGFLQNMVRIMTGTLLEIGYGEKSLSQIHDILESKDRKNAGFMAPACGLCLMEVEYN